MSEQVAAPAAPRDTHSRYVFALPEGGDKKSSTGEGQGFL